MMTNIPKSTQVTKPTTRSDESQTKRKHININIEVGTQTQKDQHRPRNEGGSKPKGQEPKNQQNDNIAVVGDSMLKFIDVRRLGKGINKKLIVKTFPGAKVDDMIHYVKPTLNRQILR